MAHSPSVKGVPEMSAVASPEIVLAGRPAAERASNARAGGVETFLLVGVSIQNHGRFGNVIQDGRSPCLG